MTALPISHFCSASSYSSLTCSNFSRTITSSRKGKVKPCTSRFLSFICPFHALLSKRLTPCLFIGSDSFLWTMTLALGYIKAACVSPPAGCQCNPVPWPRPSVDIGEDARGSAITISSRLIRLCPSRRDQGCASCPLSRWPLLRPSATSCRCHPTPSSRLHGQGALHTSRGASTDLLMLYRLQINRRQSTDNLQRLLHVV